MLTLMIVSAVACAFVGFVWGACNSLDYLLWQGKRLLLTMRTNRARTQELMAARWKDIERGIVP